MLTREDIGKLILVKAREFSGLREVASNRRWSDEKKSDALLRWMGLVGWQPGWPYCAAACEAVWRWAYQAAGIETFFLKSVAPVLGPHCMTMFRVAQERGLIITEPTRAIPGAIIIWRHGKTDNGHAGLFRAWEQFSPWQLLTIEANTGSGNEREGDGIYAKRRPYPVMGNLVFQGIINPWVPT